MSENKITIGTLKRCLKIYDPQFVTFWNAKKTYKQFHNDMGLLILKLESQSDDVRLHSAGFKIRVLHQCDSHVLAEIMENHGEFRKGERVRVLREHVEELPK